MPAPIAKASSEWPNSLGNQYKDHTFREGVRAASFRTPGPLMPAAFDSSSGHSPDGAAAGFGALSQVGEGQLLDLVRIATFVLDPDGRIAVWSPAAADLTGRPVEELLASNVAGLF